MKKNGIFFIAFLLLFSFTYIYEKQGHEDRNQKVEEDKKIFNVTTYGKLIGIQTKKMFLTKKDEQFFVGKLNYPADQLVVNRMFDLFGNMKSERFLEDEIILQNRKSFFPHDDQVISFIFEKGKLECLVGSKLQHDQSFYLKIIKNNESQIVIAKVDKALVGIHTHADQINSDYYYNQLVSLLSVGEQVFYSRKINSVNIKDNPLQKIHFLSDQFSIDVADFQQNHVPLKGISLSLLKIQSFVSKFLNLQGTHVFIDIFKSDLESKIAQISLEYVVKKVNLTLFRKFKGRVGWFVWNDLTKVMFEIERASTRYFFQKEQNFWDKRILQGNVFSKFSLSYKGKLFELVKDLQWQLSGKNSRSLDQIKIKKLMKIFLKTADLVENKNLLNGKVEGREIFKIRVLGREITVLESLGDLMFWNKADGLLFHFWVGQDMPFDPKWENYFL